MALVWQDVVFTVGQFIFLVSLLPTIMDAKAQVPRKTSVPTAAIMLAFTVTYVSLQLYFAAVLGLVIAAAWAVVAWKRPIRK